MSFVYVGGRG